MAKAHTMGTKEELPPPPPKLVKLNNALKLAERWVSTMSGYPEEEAADVDFEMNSRPSGLGLGAKAPQKSQFRPSNDPVERKLQKKLHFGKKKVDGDEVSAPSAKDEDSDDEENLDSRTNAFIAKKRASPQIIMAQPKKKPRFKF